MNLIKVSGNILKTTINGVPFAFAVSEDNMPYIFPVTGRTSGTPTNGTMVFSATEDVPVTAYGDVVIVSVTRAADDVYRRHTVVFSCPNNGIGKLIITGKSKVVSLGNHRGVSNPNVEFYLGTNATAPILTWNIADIPNNIQKIHQTTTHANILPGIGSGKLPDVLFYMDIRGDNIGWEIIGALPVSLLYYVILTNGITWENSDSLPPLSRVNYLNGNNLNWTGTTIGSDIAPPNTGGLSIGMSLLNFRNPSDTMTYTELLQLLDGLINRVGTLPTTVVIREQIPANVTAIAAAAPNIGGTEAEQCKYYINLIKSTKGVTTFTLNTTNI